MLLSLKQAAKVFDVAETKLIEWITQDNLPAELVGGQYYFNQAELLEWAAVRRQPFKPEIYLKVNGDLNPSATHLADALEIGGVLQDVGGADLREILGNALDGLPIPDSFGADAVLELILMREEVGSTAIGGGVAIPHPRQPIILTVGAPVVRLCYLSQPLDLNSRDGKPVDKLFLMICPTAHDHLQLLARLGAVLRVDSVLAALNAKAGTKQIVEAVRAAGSRFDTQPSEIEKAS
ncbi:MAG: PTS sugar transporter subunit IIA [Planctomycetales bacterium]|nr:PTS sugar transporter subunit IIA [Planctomycetales bacterium]